MEWLTVDDHRGPWPDVEEPHDTYLDNALEKARAVAAALGVPAVADDSGLEVDALGGAPGPALGAVRGRGRERRARTSTKLLAALGDVPAERRTARYRCVAAIAWPDGGEVWAEGTCEGRLEVDAAGIAAASATTRPSSRRARTARWPS